MKSLLLASVISMVSSSTLSDFTCLDDPKKIYFNNSQDKEVPDLPTVRIMMCGYSSQCALGYAAYMFMREKLGINVTFYPVTDPSIGWASQVNDPNLSDDPGYPENYFWWLANDYMDINFEFWPTQTTAGNGEEYMLTGAVDFGGFVGAYGEESIWIPKYLVDDIPSAIVPNEIKTNQILRNLFINGSRYGDYDYISLYNESAFDNPNYDIPTVWGSWASYFMSQYAYNLTQNVEGGLNVSFVTIGAEGNVAALVKDLYSRRSAFMANVYTVDDNFGTIDVNTSELQEFEKIAFDRNPDQSAYDPCFVAAECQYHVAPLMKAANPLLQSRFPEAYQFFTGFSMGTTQINSLISYYLALADSSMSTSEKWLNASCEWLKDPDSESTWDVSSWNVDIFRYDCDTDCGIDGYGGECDYYTGECICDYDELFSDTYCKESCPGLVGPYLNDSDVYTFDFCSGAGICDVLTRSCECDLGYGDTGCGTKYEEYEYVILSIIVIAFSSILAVIGIGCIIWLRMNSKYKTVKALSVDMTTIMTFGIISITSSNIALVVPVNDISCIAWQWLFGLGGILSIMSPLLKAYRVSRVFHGGKMLRAVKITDKMLMATLIKAAVIEMLLCIAYSVAHQLFGGTELYYNDEELRTEAKCNNDTITSYLSMGSYAYFFVALCALTYYSWGTRRALSVFKESTCAYFSSFLSLLCTLITFVFYMATSDPAFRVAVQSFAIILVISAVLSLFYGTRIYAFVSEPENRNVTDARAASHTSTASHASTSVMKPGPSAQS